MSLSNLIQNAAQVLSNNSPTILSGIAATTSVVTAVLASRASFAAADDIREEAERRNMMQVTPKPITTQEKVVMVWKHYIPAAATGTVTVVCIIAAHRIGAKRAAAMAAAYTVSREAFAEYKDKVAEKIGIAKEQKMRDEIAQDQVNKNPASNNQVIVTGTGKVQCYDSITGRYFLSNAETIRRAENLVNREINHNMYVTATQFFEHIGLPGTPYSNEIGWNTDYPLTVKFTTVISEDDIPCLSINYEWFPIRGYDVIF